MTVIDNKSISNHLSMPKGYLRHGVRTGTYKRWSQQAPTPCVAEPAAGHRISVSERSLLVVVNPWLEVTSRVM